MLKKIITGGKIIPSEQIQKNDKKKKDKKNVKGDISKDKENN